MASFLSVLALLASIPSPPTDRIEIGPLTFRFYGLMIALGIFAAVEMGRRRWAVRGGEPDDIIEIAKWGVPAGLIGSRIYHVITDWTTTYQDDPLRAFEIWNGGLGIPGGLLLGVGVGIWYVRRRGWDVTSLIDTIIPGIPVAQAIGRLGNWFNQEVFGGPTDLPWALEIDEQFRPSEFSDEPTFHPTFLYEGLWNLALAGGLILLERRGKLKPGQMLPLWITGYGVGRFLVEQIRIDDATEILGLRVNTWVSGGAVIIGLTWFWWAGRRADRDVVVDNATVDEEAADETAIELDSATDTIENEEAGA